MPLHSSNGTNQVEIIMPPMLLLRVTPFKIKISAYSCRGIEAMTVPTLQYFYPCSETPCNLGTSNFYKPVPIQIAQLKK